MYNPRNGPPYSAEFQARYHAAQVERNHKITRWCQRKLSEIAALGNPLMTDVPFIIHRTDRPASELLLALHTRMAASAAGTGVNLRHADFHGSGA